MYKKNKKVIQIILTDLVVIMATTFSFGIVMDSTASEVGNKQNQKVLTDEINSLEGEINQSIGFVRLNEAIVNYSDQVDVKIPEDIKNGNFEAAFIAYNGEYVDCSIGFQPNHLIIKNLYPGKTYELKIFTDTKNYIMKITVSQYKKIDNRIENVVRIPANPERGFNYSYFLYIPSNMQKMPERRLLVECDNSNPANLNYFFEKNAYEVITDNYLKTIGQKLKIPVLVPAFPRDVHNPGQDDYPYLQYLNRGSLTTRDTAKRRADIQLISMIKDAQSQLAFNNIKISDKVFMTGFSASSKFADRFAIIHPDIILAVAVGGLGGTVVLPFKELNGEAIRYPVGVNDLKDLTGSEFNLEEYKKIPQFFYMGENDTNDGTEWRDCYEEQDAEAIWKLLGRKDMPDRWNNTQNLLKGVLNKVQFKTYKGIGHDITSEVTDDVTNFFKSHWNNNIAKSRTNSDMNAGGTGINENQLRESASNLQNIIKVQNSSNVDFKHWRNLPNLININNDKAISVNMPFDFGAVGFQGAILYSGNKITDAAYTFEKNKLVITPANALLNGENYLLKIYTCEGKYSCKITVNDVYKFNTVINNVIRISASAKKGFNYPYYLFIPKNIDKLPQRRLLVECLNSPVPNDTAAVFEKEAFDLVSGGVPHIYGQRMQIPVLIPAFPRDFYEGKDDYPYLQFLNRGALSTKDTLEKRADNQLIAMIKDAQSQLAHNGINVADKIIITGYSSSGKFAQRFTALHPDCVRALAAGGIAGTTIFPLEQYNGNTLRYPVGIGDLKELAGIDFDLDSYKKVDQYLYMGEFDTNDATEWKDCFEEQDSHIIWKLFGRKQLPDRWNKTQEILRDFPEIKFRTYTGIGHEINHVIINDVVGFFQNTGLMDVLEETNDTQTGIDFTNAPDFKNINVTNDTNSVNNSGPAVQKNNEYKDLPQFSTGVKVVKGTGKLTNAVGIAIDRNKLPSGMQKFVYISIPCYPVYTPDAIKNILQYKKDNGVMEEGLMEYSDKFGYIYAEGSLSCFVVLYDKNENPLGYAIVKNCVVQG